MCRVWIKGSFSPGAAASIIALEKIHVRAGADLGVGQGGPGSRPLADPNLYKFAATNKSRRLTLS